MKRQNFVMRIYKKDRRYKSGVRVFGTYQYEDVDPKWMEEEIRYLRTTMYQHGAGYSMEVSQVQEFE